MALLTATQASVAGVAPDYQAAAAGGDTFQPGDHTSVYVDNASGAAVTVTIVSQVKCNQGFEHDLSVAVAAGARICIGPLPAGRYADANGLAHISYSATASVTVAVVNS